jgi:hypothetical protein
MNYDKAYNALTKVTEKKKKCKKLIWVRSDGVFSEDESKDLNDESISYCSVSYSEEFNIWTVTPWLFTADCAASFRDLSSARDMACFWLYWMGLIYGDGLIKPKFEADWVSVKSNRSLLEILFCQEGETLKRELWKAEGITDISPYIGASGIKIITPSVLLKGDNA